MNWEPIIETLKSKPITWVANKEQSRYYRAMVDGAEYTLRLNDFPEEPASTLFQGNEDEGVDVEGIPMHWHWRDEG